MKTNASKLNICLILGVIIAVQSGCESPNAYKGANVILGAQTSGIASEPAKPSQQAAVSELQPSADEAWQTTIERKWWIAPLTDRRNVDREPSDRYMGPDGFGVSHPFGSGLDRPFGENRIYFGLWSHSF